jgi:hypothetical protein
MSLRIFRRDVKNRNGNRLPFRRKVMGKKDQWFFVRGVLIVYTDDSKNIEKEEEKKVWYQSEYVHHFWAENEDGVKKQIEERQVNSKVVITSIEPLGREYGEYA